MNVFLFEATYYLPNNPGNSGGTFTFIAENVLQVRTAINKQFPRKMRLVDGEDTLKIERIQPITLPLQLN